MKIKVLHIINALGRGGAEVLLRDGLKYSNDKYYEYHYIYIKSHPNDMAKEVTAQGGKVLSLKADGLFQLIFVPYKIRKYVKRNSIDIIHSHLTVSGILARVSFLFTNIPVVHTEHNIIDRYPYLLRKIHIILWKRFSKVIAISDDVKENIDKNIKNNINSEIIYNGIDLEYYEEYACKKNNSKVPVVGTVANIRKQKRIDIFIRVAKKVKSMGYRCKFVIVGDGVMMDQMKAYSKENNVDDILEFVGKKKDVRPYLTAMDLFILTSEYEGFGIVIIEAMAMKIPVISTKVSGVSNIIQNGNNGILVEYNNETENNMAKEIIDLISDEERIKRITKNAHSMVNERYGMKKMQKKIEETYSKLMLA